MDPDEDPYAIVMLDIEIAVISSPALTVMSDGVRDMIVGSESTPDSQNSSSLVTRGSSQVTLKSKHITILSDHESVVAEVKVNDVKPVKSKPAISSLQPVIDTPSETPPVTTIVASYQLGQ